MLWIERWMRIHAVVLLCAVVLFLKTENILFIVIGAAISFAAFFIWNRLKTQQSSFAFQAANLVTTFRLLTLWLLCYYSIEWADWIIGSLALLVLLLDGLDGYLARRFNTASDFGAYLDMETDAFFVLSLSSLLYLQGKVGFWILGVGCLRYVYFLILLLFKPKAQKEGRHYFAQAIAVFLMGSLVAGFLLPAEIYQPVLVVGSLLVLGSFGRSFYEVLWGEI